MIFSICLSLALSINFFGEPCNAEAKVVIEKVDENTFDVDIIFPIQNNVKYHFFKSDHTLVDSDFSESNIRLNEKGAYYCQIIVANECGQKVQFELK